MIELSNGIQALLVSNLDQKKQKAACSCCVQARMAVGVTWQWQWLSWQVGSFSDPKLCEGLAHYCALFGKFSASEMATALV